MNKFYHILGAALLAPTISFGQTVGTMQLDHNDCSAQLNANGTLFYDIANMLGGYTVPKEDSIPTIYSMNLMAFGDDINDQIHGAIAYAFNSDFKAGPVAQEYSTPNFINGYNRFWKVSKAEIDYHIANWNTVGYVLSDNIASWPGNGDITNGEAFQLAPFYDVNQDGVYNPDQGDYPIIRGDEAVYCILNDRNGVHNSGTSPMGIELHLMFYQYSSLGGDYDHTTFIHTQLFNRGTITLYNFRFGALMDFDLGNPNDDYMGTDLSHNMTYVYNGDPYDDMESGHPGFYQNPPAVGLMVLNKPLRSNVISSVLSSSPSTPNEYRNLMSGLNTDGSTIYHNGDATPYVYSDTITDSTGWNEFASFNPLGGRYSYFSVSDDDGILQPWEYMCSDFAIIYARSTEGNIFSSVDSLFQVASEVQAFYDSQAYLCTASELGLKDNKEINVTIYPNPVNDVINLNGMEAGRFTITAADGRIVSTGVFSNQLIDVKALPQGYYQLILETESGVATTNFVK